MRTALKSSDPTPSATTVGQAPQPAQAGGPRMRTVPRQQRARAAVSRILQVTGELLDEAGYDALTTTAVAERAEVNIATLYRYFPDKYALIEALAMEIEAERSEKVAPMLAALPAAADWRREVRSMFERMIDLRLKRSGVKGLRRALSSAPQLWTIERAGFGRMADQLAEAIRARKPSMTARRADLIGRTCLTLITGMLDWATSEPEHRRTIVREGNAAIESYLQPYLD